MTLRDRVRRIGVGAGVLFLALLAVFLNAWLAQRATDQMVAATDTLTLRTIQLRAALFSHLLQPEQVPHAQVLAQFEALDALLRQQQQAFVAATGTDPRARFAWESVRRLSGELRQLLAEHSARSPVAPQLAERHRRTRELLLVNSHALQLHTSQLRDAASAAARRTTARAQWAYVSLVGGLLILLGTLLAVVDRGVLKPISALHQAATRIARGERALRTHSARDDELGDLGRAFDRMLDQIEADTVSRARLAVEAGERSRVEERLQLALEVSRTFAFEWEPATDRLVRSQSAARILGLPAAQAAADTGQEATRQVEFGDRGRLRALRAGLRPDQDHYRIAYRARRGDDGRTVMLEETARGLFDADGTLVRLIGATTDNTERHLAEAGLRLAHARFQRLMDANIIGVGIADANGGVLEANEYMLGLIGGSQVELAAGRLDWRRVTPPEWLWADEQAIAELRTHGVCRPYEKEYQRPDGSRVPVLIADAMLPGPAGQILAMVSDISAVKQAQAQIATLNAELEERVRQRTAELQAANQELESFSYAVSHDLRAPLRALSGFSQALLEDYGERLDGEARSYLEQIDTASQHMGRLINGILSLSRITRGELSRERVDLGVIARRLLSEHAGEEPGRRVDWSVGSGLTVTGDPDMLEAALANLIDNAWKYSEHTELAHIRVYADGPRAEDPPGTRWVCVADNGAGFDMAYAERLFQPFQRLHRQDEFPGLGIGLATVQRIIHRHGGRITAEGSPGNGARFRFTLPASS